MLFVCAASLDTGLASVHCLTTSSCFMCLNEYLKPGDGFEPVLKDIKITLGSAFIVAGVHPKKPAWP